MKITGIEKSLSSTDLNFGDRYLTLDGVPSRTWVNLFEDAYKNYFSPNKPKVQVTNTWLVVSCPLNDLQSHINTLTGLIQRVNEQVVSMRQQAERKAQEQSMLDSENKRKADEAYNKLKFD
ncbi:hypothetical protein MZUP3_790 [Erwinia phage vB_EhrS_49]|uniref:Uncharacterized protein n=2 Tax=Feofaniavirus TaxID=2733174 RepID=A0A4Y1NRM2_9CAUD|nr:hypothetical protein HOV54_gp79 [Erwinia phage vB_EhrS_49]YP_009824109.1 hypothetical protein HOV55_gp79 [Erwinia phage vB_EhrS_59]AXH43478.1 hypothetical protein MZUP3_790 [Erwinia phage vB_EhrS_49]AXH43597.1 hypothetical protein MZUP2_790 [Erwinia phage vB_EhrS_59]